MGSIRTIRRFISAIMVAITGTVPRIHGVVSCLFMYEVIK